MEGPLWPELEKELKFLKGVVVLPSTEQRYLTGAWAWIDLEEWLILRNVICVI